MLRQRLASVLQRPALDLPLLAPPGQPPRLAACAGWVALSHSGRGVLIGWSAEALGVDLEPAARSFPARGLMQRFFPAAEQRQLEGLPEARLRQAVLQSWLLKEAAIKWRRRTLAGELACWGFDHQQGWLRHRTEAVQPAWQSGFCCGWRWAVVTREEQPMVLHLQADAEAPW